MYKFFLYQWQLGRINEEYLRGQVRLGRITEEQYNTIISTEKVV